MIDDSNSGGSEYVPVPVQSLGMVVRIPETPLHAFCRTYEAWKQATWARAPDSVLRPLWSDYCYARDRWLRVKGHR